MIRRCKKSRSARQARRGAVLPIVAVMVVALVGMLAFSVDLGYISVVRGQLQSGADAAALASASQLLDRDWLEGVSSQSTSNADAAAQRFASANVAGGVSLNLGSGDVVYGYIARPSDPACPFETDRRPYNSAQVTVQRTTVQNGELGLFFARIFNQGSLPLSARATATYEGNIGGFEFNDNYPGQKCLLLPFSLDYRIWDDALNEVIESNDNWAYDPVTQTAVPGKDGINEVKLFPTKKLAPGNFGTVDIGDSNNSASDLARQILHGPNKADFDLMGGKVELGPDGKLVLNGDTGISAGVKDELESIIGMPRIIPLHESVTGNGNNAMFTIVRFVGCVILEVKLTGGDKYVMIQPEFATDSTAIGGGPESDHSFVYKPLKLTR